MEFFKKQQKEIEKTIKEAPKDGLSLIPQYLKYIIPMVDFGVGEKIEKDEITAHQEAYPSFMGSDGVQKVISIDASYEDVSF